MKGRKKTAKIAVSLVLVVALIAAGCIYIVKKNEADKYKAVIMEVATDTITQTLSTTGTVESTNRGEFLIYGGVVAKEVHVKLGDRVEKGQLLATFEPSSLNSIVSAVQSEYDTAKINYHNSISAANEAAAKIPALDAQIGELEKQVAELAKAAEAAGADTQAEENVPSWIDSIDYDTLTKLLGYSKEELRSFFIRMSNGGTSRTTISDIVESLKSATTFDLSSVMGSSPEETELMSAKLNLLSLKAQKTLLETQSQNVLESTYKSLMDSAKAKLDSAKAAVNKLANGWYAEGDGIVSALNISAGQAFVPVSSSQSVDVNTILGMLSGGSSADLSGMLSSLIGSGDSASVGMAVEYYDSFVASFALGKADILDVKLGKEAKITSLGREFEGEIVYISPVATATSSLDISTMLSSMTGGSSSAGSNSIPAKVLIKQPDESIIIGIDVNIDIVVDTVENAVVVPIEAVETSAAGSFVYKYDEKTETVSRVEVELGLASDTQYQIISGCEAGEKIVQNQSTALQEIAQEGKKVAATPYETETAV